MTVRAATGSTSVQLSTGLNVSHDVYTHIVTQARQAPPEVLSRLLRAINYDLKKNPYLMDVRSSMLQEANMTRIPYKTGERGQVIRLQDTKIPEGQIVQILRAVLRREASGAVSVVDEING